MVKYIDLTGQKFGKLTVVEYSGKSYNDYAQWLCNCECGNTRVVQGKRLRNGMTKSCGCLTTATHGMSYSRLYETYNKMKDRCSKPKTTGFNNYGGRGISVCEAWEQFDAFHIWAIKSGYNDNLTIERIDVNGNYCPENCCWITKAAQQRNKRNTQYLTAFGETKTVKDWSEDSRCTVSYEALRNRIKSGMNPEPAITLPRRN
jgi:hypothetical protein